MHQLSMDGPNVNWSILAKMQKKREEEEFSPLEDVDVACCFRLFPKWDLEKVLRAIWKLLDKSLLDKSPAYGGEFLKVCTVSPPLFPMKFCATRWVENEMVASKAISIVQLIKEYMLKPASKRPKNNVSFDNLVASCKYILIPVKLHIFQDIAAMLNTFLVKFQSNVPLVSFLADTLEHIIRRFMKLFLLKKAVDDANNQYKLNSLDIDEMQTTNTSLIHLI